MKKGRELDDTKWTICSMKPIVCMTFLILECAFVRCLIFVLCPLFFRRFPNRKMVVIAVSLLVNTLTTSQKTDLSPLNRLAAKDKLVKCQF